MNEPSNLSYLERVQRTANQFEQLSPISTPASNTDLFDRVLEQGLTLMQDDQWQSVPGTIKAQFINGLGQIYYTRYQINSSREDIDNAIRYFQQALVFVANTQRRRASVLSNLSSALQLRYTYSGETKDIQNAVETALEAAQLISSDLPEKPSYLSNWATALYERYGAYGQITDLDTAIDSTEQAITLTSGNSPRRIDRLNNLAALRQERYSRLGELRDLTLAVDLYHEVIQKIASDNPNRPIYLNNLGGCLLDLYRRNKNQNDLENAIETLRTAIMDTPLHSPYRPGFLNNLGNALSTFFQKTGHLDSLREAIEVQSEAEKLVDGSPLQASFLTSLGSSLVEYFLKTLDEVSLDRSVAVCTKAVNITPASSPKLSSRWNNLARSLMERFKRSGKLEDQEQAQSAYRKACENGLNLQTEVTLLAGYNWGEWALQRSEWAEAAEALGFAMLASRQLFLRQSLRSDRESWLREAQVLPAIAAYAHAKNGNFMEALMSLETGRTRLLAEMLHLYDSRLESLRKGAYNVYFEKYVQAVDQVTRLDQGEVSIPQNEAAVREARLELSRVISEIQMLPGFQDFFRDPESLDINAILVRSNLDAIVHIVITSVGGLALITDKTGVEPIWLDVNSGELDHIMLGDTSNPERGYLGAILGYVYSSGIIEDVCHWLGQKIMMPIQACLERRSASKICLIPTGTLALLPLSAGQYYDKDESKIWLQNTVITHTPSLTLLQHDLDNLLKLKSNSPSLLAIANPLPLPQELPVLKFAPDEVKAIAGFFSGSSLLLSGKDASVENIMRHLPVASFLHFAGHATFDVDKPFNSGMILSQGERLRIVDLIGKPVFTNSRLAVLSSCQTAIIDFTRIPEEAIGLPAGFLQAGMPAVMSTLWKVNDLSTAMLMIRFYQYLLDSNLNSIIEPMRPSMALRQAQLWLRDLSAQEIDEFVEVFLPTHLGRARLREDDTFSNPYYWAGFTITGV